MLQKILVVLVGLVMSLVGALTPGDLFSAQRANDPLGLGDVQAAEETLATVRELDGQAFARVSVLWAEVDGKRVVEDAWGTGEVRELKFKVGVKDVDGLKLAVGDKRVPLRPTDVITIRLFDGDFAFRGASTNAMSVQLQGVVKTALVSPGGPTGKLQTTTAEHETRIAERATGAVQRVAYVVLSTGDAVDTVAVQNGGARVRTEEIVNAKPADEPGNLLVKWVKIDGNPVREYTWGEGDVSRIEFEPSLALGQSVVLRFDEKTVEATAGSHVLVRDFVGEHLVYQVQGGLLRLRLDGYAANLTQGQGGVSLERKPGAPIAAFEAAPDVAHTTDLIQFKDRSRDDGVIVLWRWDFGDGTFAAMQDPTHRYLRPGIYNVTLNVTDDDLHSSQSTYALVVRNADPVPEFDLMPRIVHTDTLVAFTDHSLDRDGMVVNWSWDFGDGQVSYARHPQHKFVKSGNLEVRLTVTDDLGGKATTKRNVLVRNAPPIAGFTFGPEAFRAREFVTFESTSRDRDGRIVSYEWNFGDSNDKTAPQAFGPVVTHSFPRPGVFTVRLTVTDDAGDVDTVTTTLQVLNTPPNVDFTWSPNPFDSTDVVTFQSTSTDPDGFIILNEWDFDDGTDTIIVRAIDDCPQPRGSSRYASCQERLTNTTTYDPFRADGSVTNTPPFYRPPPDIPHQFRTNGSYDVTLCVTDNMANLNQDDPGRRVNDAFGRQCKTRPVNVDNAAPVPQVDWVPKPVFRFRDITFTANGTRDTDGDPWSVVSWRFSDIGIHASVDKWLVRQFTALGQHWVNLTVTDGNHTSYVNATFTVLNFDPTADFTIAPETVHPNETVYLNATFADPDGVNCCNVTWDLPGAMPDMYGANIELNFTQPQTILVTLVVSDLEAPPGRVTVTKSINVVNIPPQPEFTWTPDNQTEGQEVQFIDLSFVPPGQSISSWTWSFGDNTPAVTVTDPLQKNVKHTYAANDTYTVTLTLNGDPELRISHPVFINGRPEVSWFYEPLAPSVNRPVNFTDTTLDDQGIPGIAQRIWDFGDGTPPVVLGEADTNIQHVFLVPGDHVVTLTVIDDHGASGSLSKKLTLDNQGPTARWRLNTTTPTANAPTCFTANPSTDPNGNETIRFWSWDFGDGATAAGNATALKDPCHTYATSGIYRVTLIVGDGGLFSAPATGFVRIGADHPLDYTVCAELPNGDVVNVLGPTYTPTLTFRPVMAKADVLTKLDMTPDGDCGVFTLAAGVWADGDLVFIKLDARFGDQTISTSRNFVLADADDDVDVDFVIPLPLVATVRAHANDDNGLVPGFHSGNTSDGSVVYHSMNEPFHGNGTVEFLDGTDVDNAQVIVELRYLPGDLPTGGRPLRDVLHTPDNAILGWCVADRTTTAANGSFTWSVGEDNECALPKMDLFVFGQWEVRVRVSYPGAPNGVSAPHTIYVDPTGVFAHTYLP